MFLIVQCIQNKKDEMNRGNRRRRDTRNMYRILVGKSQRKRPCGRSRFRIKYNIG
jgi:hypothetical protein